MCPFQRCSTSPGDAPGFQLACSGIFRERSRAPLPHPAWGGEGSRLLLKTQVLRLPALQVASERRGVILSF